MLISIAGFNQKGEIMKSKVAKITFINSAYSNRNADIVIFQKDHISGSIIYAWHVIHNCGYAYTHCFEYNKTPDLVIRDFYGNQLVLSNVKKGMLYSFSRETGILEKTESLNSELIEVQNLLAEGTITASISRNSRLMYEKTEICPEEIVSFSSNNDIYVGRVESIKEGQIIDEKLLNRFTTKISLEHIKSADLVLKGGGFGPKAQKYCFVLENIENE